MVESTVQDGSEYDLDVSEYSVDVSDYILNGLMIIITQVVP